MKKLHSGDLEGARIQGLRDGFRIHQRLRMEVRRMAEELFKGSPQDRMLAESWFRIIGEIEACQK